MRLCTVGLVATLVLAVLVAPRAATAQQPGKVFRVVELNPAPAAVEPSRVFRQALRELGYIRHYRF